MTQKLKHLWDKFRKDRHGKVVLWQAPNIAILGWIMLKGASMLVHQDWLKSGLESLSTAFLFTWAYLELSSGVNYFRRLLGLIVLVAIIFSFFRI